MQQTLTFGLKSANMGKVYEYMDTKGTEIYEKNCIEKIR